MAIRVLFDYGSLDSESRIVVRRKTAEIKERVRRTRRTIIEIGERLIDVKARLGHGQFGRWLEAEFEWSCRMAQELMNVAQAFKCALNADLDIGPTAMRSLAAPSVPEAARREAISRAEGGDKIGVREAKEIIARHRRPTSETLPAVPDERCPDGPPASPGSEVAWLIEVKNSHLSLRDLLVAYPPHGLNKKTPPVSCQYEEGKIQVPKGGWKNAGCGGKGEALTFRMMSESPRDVVASSLWDILEMPSPPSAPSLTAKTCRRILERLARDGRKHPPEMIAMIEACLARQEGAGAQD
jgi:hypothetical protein